MFQSGFIRSRSDGNPVRKTLGVIATWRENFISITNGKSLRTVRKIWNNLILVTTVRTDQPRWESCSRLVTVSVDPSAIASRIFSMPPRI